MKLTSIDTTPFHALTYEAASPLREIVTDELPFLRATVDRLPDGIDALIATSELQGREPRKRVGEPPGRLLGECLAEEIADLSAAERLPPANRIGVSLAGDFIARPALDRRGGSGDVRGVWLAVRVVFRGDRNETRRLAIRG